MKFEEINYALKNLIHRKVRSWLTVLSILIGVMAIYAIISFGLGMQNYIDTVAADAGADKLFVQAKGTGAPGTDTSFSLSKDDVNFIKKIRGVEKAEGMYVKAGKIESRGEKKYNFLMGSDPKEVEFIFESFGVDILEGRSLKKGDSDKIVLGYSYFKDNKIFKKKLNVGEKIYLNDKKYEIVGIVNEIGNPSDDANIYLTLEQFESIYPDEKDKFGFVMVKSEKFQDPEILADTITEKLRKRKDQKEGEETFYVQTFADAVETFGTIINVINSILFLIALISVIVASVNIMNTMYTSVLERTKEIGIMKAIGARNGDIAFIFVFESGVLGLIGGVLGILFGYIIATIGGIVGKSLGYALLAPIFPWYLTVGSLLFSFFIGIIAGLFPALQASRQNPVDALRYE